jgi:hypothetical protein
MCRGIITNSAAWVLQPHCGTEEAGSILLSQADYQFIGEDAHNFAGYSLTSAGDVDGDGLSDILIGASGHNSGGESAKPGAVG